LDKEKSSENSRSSGGSIEHKRISPGAMKSKGEKKLTKGETDAETISRKGGVIPIFLAEKKGGRSKNMPGRGASVQSRGRKRCWSLCDWEKTT